MGYKEKYNKLVEAIKVLQETNPSDEGIQNWVNDYLPELAESEDEKIRQELIAIYSVGARGNMKTGDIPDKDIVDWLEKHGEPNPYSGVSFEFNGNTWGMCARDNGVDILLNAQFFKHLDEQGEQPRYNIGDIICDKSCTTLNKDAQPNMEIVDIKNGMYICDKGSFPVSQQDEYELVSRKIDTKLNDDSVSNELRAASVKHAEKEIKNPTCPDNEEFELVYTFEEGAKWDAAQKHNWSDEDEEMAEKLLGWLNTLINYIQGDATVSLDLYRERTQQVEIIKTWLKSLKALNTWKPSDKQIKALENFTRSVAESGYISPYDDNTKLLYSLLEDLKKLK